MEEVRNIRINKVLKELNIPLTKAIGFLNENGIAIKTNINSKISEKESEILKKQYLKPKIILLIEEEFDFRISLRKDLEDKMSGVELKNFYTLHEDGEIKGLNIKIFDFVYDNNSYVQILNKQKKLFQLLKEIPRLVALELPKNDFIEYNEIGELINLKHLDLYDNQLIDISFLVRLTQLEYLNLSRNKIKNISSLKELINLKVLDLSENEIENISILKKLKGLENLNLAANNISNIDVFNGYKKFETLILNDNEIVELTSLKNIEFSESLSFSNNKVFDLTPLYYSLKEGKIQFHNKFENPLRYPPKEFIRATEEQVCLWFEKNLETARERIRECKRYEDKKLDLGNCGLTDLSLLPELFEKNTHIQELILSNHYAMYDNDYWNKVESNGLNPNNISFIPNSISNLKALKILIVGGDWKQGKEWNRWRLKNVTNLMKLSGLRVLNISNNQIEKLNGLNNLSNLESFHANNNELKKVEDLGELENLKEIYLSNNKLTDVSFLKDLDSVKTIDLHSNNIKDLSPLQNLIEKIGITNGKWNINTINIIDNALDEIFINIINNNNLAEREINIENYFERLKQGDKIEIERIKLILIGNTNAGKTTLADILSKGKKAKEGSTHGVNFFKYKMDKIEVNGYDFGGQDYYHNTHYTFFDNKAIYLLICGNKQKNEFALLENKINEEINSNDILFPLNYWLGSLNRFAYENIVENFYDELKNVLKLNIVAREDIENVLIEKKLIDNEYNANEKIIIEGKNIENLINIILNEENLPSIDLIKEKEDVKEFIKRSDISFKNFKTIVQKVFNILKYNFTDENKFSFKASVFQNVNENKLWFNELEFKNKYDFVLDFNSADFKEEEESVKNIIKQNLNKLANTKEFKLKTQLNRIDYDIASIFEKEADKVIIKKEDVLKLDKRIEKYNESQINSLLKSLDSVMACYYFEVSDKIKEQINSDLVSIVIVNIEKFTEWIYKILDHRNSNDLIFIKDGYFNRKDAESCLNDELAKNNLNYILAFMLEHKLIFKMMNHDSFFVPNRLKVEQSITENLFLGSFQNPIVKYEFKEYFHTSILSEIISEYYNELLKEETKFEYVLWKNKVLLYDNEQNRIVLISFNIENTPSIKISKFNNSVSDEFILRICKSIEIKINSYDYNKLVLSPKGNYVPIEILKNKNKTEENKVSNIVIYKNREYKRSDFKMFLTEKEKKEYSMKKVFVSYSHSDSDYMKELLKFLKGLERNGDIQKWTDLELSAGIIVEDEILKNLEEADIVILLISQNFIASDFIYNKELPLAMQKKINGKGNIIPIYLEQCTVFDLKLNITKPDNSFENLKMGKYYFVPQNADNNLQPINEWGEFKNKAWMKVYEEIKKLIKP